jgi:hypothetical protein
MKTGPIRYNRLSRNEKAKTGPRYLVGIGDVFIFSLMFAMVNPDHICV